MLKRYLAALAIGVIFGCAQPVSAGVQQEVGVNGFDAASTWQRIGAQTANSDSIASTRIGAINVSFLHGFDDAASTWNRIRAGDVSGDGFATGAQTGFLASRSHLYVSNGGAGAGSTWNRARDITAGDNLSTGLLAAGLYGFDGATEDRLRTVQGLGDANAGIGLFAAGTFLFNGATFDRARSAQITGTTTTMTLGVTPAALYGFDGGGASINTYRPVGLFGNRALVSANVSSGVNNITTNTDTLIDAGAANSITLIRVIVGQIGTTSTVVIRSEPDGAAPCGGTVLATLATTIAQVWEIGLVNSNDLCLTTAGGAAADLTIITAVDVD